MLARLRLLLWSHVFSQNPQSIIDVPSIPGVEVNAAAPLTALSECHSPMIGLLQLVVVLDVLEPTRWSQQ